MKLLLYYASGDARLSVRVKALKELTRLACVVPHAWTQDMIHVREIEERERVTLEGVQDEQG